MIEILLNLILAVLRVLLLPLKIDGLPDDVLTVFATLTVYIIDGARVVAAYTHVLYLSLLLGYVVALSALRLGWRVIRWFIRKIPFIGIE